MEVDGNIPENAPANCPGVGNESSGKAAPCEGCPNQQICASGKAREPDADLPLIEDKFKNIKNVILVLSGKGGVGKSTVSVNLSYALASASNDTVGLMDIDLCGPSVPRMTGLNQEKTHFSNSGWSTVDVSENLSAMSINFLLEDSNSSIIWRGDRKNGLIKQFMRDVDWGALDYLIVDTPPGTSDEHLTITSYLKNVNTSVVLVTTPQELSLQDVRKEISFCKKLNLNIIGVIENMRTFVCPCCQHVTEIFEPNTGGAEKMCIDLNLPFLGSVALDPEVAKSCDLGEQYVDYFPDTPAYRSYIDIAEAIKKALSK